MKAPFPWFGGKSKAAHLVWAALGDVGHYIEPFAGSLAVLLQRADPGRRVTETVNDLDGHLVNFWRAIKAAPEEVARYADWPVTELDLTARHHWLVTTGRDRIAALESDPDHYDAQAAGWWVWGVNAWIGSGWCSGDGPWHRADDGTLKKLRLGDAGQGINKQLPHLGSAGQGISAWFEALSERLRGVRITRGDWRRVLSYSTTRPLNGPVTGIFLDPPYITGSDLYAHDGAGVAEAVHAWASENGGNPEYRIVVAAYDGECLLPWRSVAWKASGGLHGDSGRERLFFSPHCLGERVTTRQPQLFAEVTP